MHVRSENISLDSGGGDNDLGNDKDLNNRWGQAEIWLAWLCKCRGHFLVLGWGADCTLEMKIFL